MRTLRFYPARSEISLSIKAAAIILATLVIYYQDLTMVGNEALRSEFMSHILAVPFLLSYILYRKRKMLMGVIPFEATTLKKKIVFTREIIGVILCLLAFLLYWHGSHTFHPLEYHMASLPLFVAGCTLIIFNTSTLKVLAFPIAFLFFLTPPPLEIVYVAGATLSTVSSQAAYEVLKVIGLPVNLATQYETPVIILEKSGGTPLTFAIDIACAGIYSLIGFTIFAVFAAYIARGVTWKKATMFLSGFPSIYALNITRIIIIVLIGYQYGMETAMHAFHLFGGWILIFLGTLLLICLSEKIWKIQIFTKTALCPKCNQNLEKKEKFCSTCGRLLKITDIKISKRDLCKISALLLSISLIMLLEVPVFALTEGPAEVITQSPGGEQASTQILPEIPNYTLQFIYRDTRFEELAKQDASLIYAYIPTNKLKTKIWVTIEVDDTQSSLHRWEVCLIRTPQVRGYPPRVTQLDLRDVQLSQNPPVIGRYFAFQEIKSNITQVILYWYEKAIFNTGSGSQQEYMKISLIAYSNNPEDISKIEKDLLPFGEAIANYWQPIKTWSQIALTIAQNGITLMTTVALTGVALLAIQFIRNQKGKKYNFKVYNMLAPEEKLILRAAHQTAQKERPTINAIASSYQKLAQKPTEFSLLLEKLNEAEEAGLVKREVISQDDEPVLIWKNQVPF